MPIAFLHTSPVHVPTFTNLLRDIGPHVLASHSVDESLLADARQMGTSDSGVIARVQASMHRAASQNSADVVVCTCSTIGHIAESMDSRKRFFPMRIDRPMADEAVQRGASILVAAALDSTLAPTRVLIQESARRMARTVHISVVAIPHAWSYFEKGDIPAYSSAIATVVEDTLAGHDVVVLAQASMAPAAELLARTTVPVLSSPRLGVLAAVNALSRRNAA